MKVNLEQSAGLSLAIHAPLYFYEGVADRVFVGLSGSSVSLPGITVGVNSSNEVFPSLFEQISVDPSSGVPYQGLEITPVSTGIGAVRFFTESLGETSDSYIYPLVLENPGIPSSDNSLGHSSPTLATSTEQPSLCQGGAEDVACKYGLFPFYSLHIPTWHGNKTVTAIPKYSGQWLDMRGMPWLPGESFSLPLYIGSKNHLQIEVTDLDRVPPADAPLLVQYYPEYTFKDTASQQLGRCLAIDDSIGYFGATVQPLNSIGVAEKKPPQTKWELITPETPVGKDNIVSCEIHGNDLVIGNGTNAYAYTYTYSYSNVDADADGKHILHWTGQVDLSGLVAGGCFDSTDGFGSSVAVSGDTIVVGAPYEDSFAKEIDGDCADNSVEGSGAAYIFTRSGSVWSKRAYLKASNADISHNFGASVAIAGDTVVVGAPGEDSFSINGVIQPVSGIDESGAAYVFRNTGGVWNQEAVLKASNAAIYAKFGSSVDIRTDTSTIVVVGSPGEANGDSSDDSSDQNKPDSGAAYVFARDGTTWTQDGYLKASNVDEGDQFGFSVALGDGVVAVGAPYEDGEAPGGVNGDESSNSKLNSGAAYVFIKQNGRWSQKSYLKALYPLDLHNFGWSLAISNTSIIIGEPMVDYSLHVNTADAYGKVYVYQ